MPDEDGPPVFADALDGHLSRPGMASGRRLLLLTGGVTALGDEPLSASFFPAALARGCDPDGMTEIVLQTHLFAGYPRTINALFALRAAGVTGTPPLEAAPPNDGRHHPFRTRGEALCRRIYGTSYPALRRNIHSLHPDLDAWMVDEGYGRVLGRPGVDVATRELAAVTALVVLDVPRQLGAHLEGAMNLGASRAEIEATLEQAAIVAPRHAMAVAQRTWRALRDGNRRAGDHQR